MVFPGYRSNNWMVTAAIISAGVGLWWEFTGVYMTPVACACFPQVMGKYTAGNGGNRQYLRWKTAYDAKTPDYTKYMEK